MMTKKFALGGDCHIATERDAHLTIDQHIEAAARLPLPDAAYLLWIRRSMLDGLEQARSSRRARPVNLRDPEALIKSAQAAFAKVRHDRATAEEGPTFLRLKRAHSKVDDDALKSAIRAALKLDEDCSRFFSREGEDLATSIAKAVDLAKRDNPIFHKQTYDLARSELARTMK
jgi:hypothetical protein